MVTPGVLWLEAKDAGEHLIVHRTVPHSKECPTQNVIGTNAEKP